ncbi:MAG: DegT/DnrJ/EryC1/StrS family aminotransferase [Candidatus Zapsychrus exili]|nr:DegT/DnrJ/EryC1/StrS family aminotransferase [Candidatus Zapsychrus exili]
MFKSINKIQACEDVLAKLLGRKQCVLTGNGTNALHIAYSLADVKRPKILLPSMMCLNPMLAVHYADRIPVFADILQKDATIDPESVSKILKEDKEISAVLAVHLYGHTADMEKLSQICKEHKAMLIEDLAQALGGSYSDGQPFGSAGDCSVVSFSYSKIIDVGDGGAIAMDDDALAGQARFMLEEFNDKRADDVLANKIYRKLFYDFWERGQKDTKAYDLFDIFPTLFKDMHIYKSTDNQASKIIDSLGNLESEVVGRRRVCEIYRNELNGIDDITFFSPKEGYSPWRFTFRVSKERRSDLLKQVRQSGFDISRWYPCISRWTSSGREQEKDSFQVADILEKEVANLWVTEGYEKRALELSKVIKKSFLKIK